MTIQTNKMGKELGKKIFPSPFTLSYFIVLILLSALIAVTAAFTFGLFVLGEFIFKGWLNALSILALAGEIWLLVALITSAINSLKIRKFENAKVEKVSLFCMHLDVVSKLFMVMGIIATVLSLVYSCVWFFSAINVLSNFVEWTGSVINGIFGWYLDLDDPNVVTPLMKHIAFAKGSPILAVMISILLPLLAGAATYFGSTTLKKTIRSYESMHVDGNAPPVKAPVVLLFVFGGVFAFIGLFLLVYFFVTLKNPSVFTEIFTTSKATAIKEICDGIKDTFENLINEKNKDFVEKIRDWLINLISVTLNKPLTFIINVLITILSVLRYLAFLAFDFALIIFGGYLATNAIMFLTLGSESKAPVEVAVATSAESSVEPEAVVTTEEESETAEESEAVEKTVEETV